MAAAGGLIFVDRFNHEQAVKALEPAVEALRRGLSIVIAPEGTRSPTPRLGKFKKGAFHLAMAAKVPIVPIVFRNTLDVLPKHGIVAAAGHRRGGGAQADPDRDLEAQGPRPPHRRDLPAVREDAGRLSVRALSHRAPRRAGCAGRNARELRGFASATIVPVARWSPIERRCAPLMLFAGWALLLLCPAVRALDEEARQSPARQSSTEVNERVTDPLSLTWSLKVKNTVTWKEVGSDGDHPEYTLQFQPTMPVWLSTDWKLIVRPEFTLVDAVPYSNQGQVSRTTGVGDTILDLALSPKLGPWLLGLGPTFVFPTANLDQTGMGKWQAGPIGVLGYRVPGWIAVLIAQQWWSFAGAADRATQNHLNLQYIASYFFGDGWSVGTSPTIKFDWRAPSGNQVTFPFGPTVGKVVKFGGVAPVKFELQGLYVPVRPDNDGERFIIQFNIIPVVPAPIAGPFCAN